MFERLIWLVPAAVAAFGIWRPRAGLLVLAACLPLFGSPPGGPYLAALDVAAIAAIATAWRAGRAGLSPLTWPAAAFVAVSLVSLVPSPYQPPSWQPSTLLGLVRALPGVPTWSALYTWRAAADLILGWGLFIAVRRAFAGRSPLPLARALMIGLSAVLVLGIASATGMLNLDGFRPHSYQRLQSVFFLSGWLSQYIVLVTPLAAAALWAKQGWSRRLCVPLLGLALVCLSLTLQRGAWGAALAQIVSLGVVFTVARRHRLAREISNALLPVAGALALMTVVLFAIGSPLKPFLERANSIESGLSPRWPLWVSATEMAKKRPLLGWGLGSFAPAYDLIHPLGSKSASPWRNTAHSLYFDIAAERGLLGLFALGILGSIATTCLFRPRAGAELLALGLGISLLGAFVYGFVQYLFHLKNIAWLLWILLGCVAQVGARERPFRGDRFAYILLGVAILLLPLRMIFGEAPTYAGNREFGLHEPENDRSGQYRWTTASAATRLPWVGEKLVLDLANGHPRASEKQPVSVEVGVDGRQVASLIIAGGWETHSIDLGPPQKEEIVLSLLVRPTFRPFSDYLDHSIPYYSLDIRSLGVAIREPRWE